MSAAQTTERIDEGDELGEKAVLRVPACDNCKSRKIKCDKNTPCSSCIASKITCRTTKRPPEKRQRVLLSKNYGEEIADVNRRLSDLANTIQTLVESNKSLAHVTTGSPVAHAITPLASSVKDDQQDTPFEGDSSFTSHSKTITEALGVALGNPPYTSNNTPSSTNSTVQRLLEDVAASTRMQPAVSSHMGQYPELSQQSLPRMAPVSKLVRLANEVPQRVFTEYPLLNIKDFTNTCQNVFFPTEEYTIATWIIVNAVLFYLFRDLDKKYLSYVGISREEAQTYVDLCSSNVLTCVQSLRITLEASLDNVESLALAASVSMEFAKSSLAWKLTASAARLCLDLGIHRQPPGSTGPQARRERVLFWTPNIHDYDMTIERPRIPDDVDGFFAEYYVGWLDYAQVQGDTYEQLFSAVAQKQPQHVRTSRAHALAARCLDLQSRLMEFDTDEEQFRPTMRDAILSTDVIIYSLLTLIYRTLPPPHDAHPLQFSDECVDSAREALKRLAAAWKEIQPQDDEAWRLFVNWTILFVPFVPFIVVFGNTIAKSSRNDLVLLEGAVRTIRGASEVAPAISKLRYACEKFCQIAAAYLAQEAAGPLQAQPVEAKTADDSEGPVIDLTVPNNVMDLGPMDFQALSDFPMQQGDWDGMLNEWDLGLGVENAREMTDWFGQYMNAGGLGFK